MDKDLSDKKLLEMEIIARSANEFVSVDIETTGFHPDKGGRIIEIGAIRIKGGKLIDTFSILINPEMSIPKKITEITGITNEMVKNKPTFREVLPTFYDFISDSILVFHNAQFDWDRFLLYYFKKVGVYPDNNTVDTLKLSRAYYPKNKDGYNLQAMCDKLNIKLENAHRATDDALATARLFYYLKEYKIKDFEDNQLSLLDNKIKKNKIKPQSIRKINYWEKEVKKGKVLKRVYVTLDRSSVFYDIPSQAWEVKSTNEPINFNEVEKEVVAFLNLKNISELQTHFS